MVTRSRTAGGLFTAVTTLALLTPTGLAPASAAVTHDLHAALHPTSAFPHAHGGADYHSDDHGRRELDVHVLGIKALAGKVVRVYVHGDFVGRTRVSSLGRAHLDRHAGVPRVTRGQAVRVRTTAGTLVCSGTFRRTTHHHDDHMG